MPATSTVCKIAVHQQNMHIALSPAIGPSHGNTHMTSDRYMYMYSNCAYQSRADGDVMHTVELPSGHY